MAKNISLLFSFLILFFSFNSYGQDTLDDGFRRDSARIMRVKNVRPQFKIDNRVAFHGTQGLAINGFELGVLLINKLRVTGGYYSMTDRLKEFNQEIGGQEFTKTIDMNYGSINTELIYRDWRFVSLGMPLEVGAV